MFIIKILTILIHLLIIKAAATADRDCLTNCKCSWTSHNLAADCSGLDITEYPTLPDDDIPQIEHLDFSKNKLTQFPYYLSKIKELTHLDLSNNKIENLAENSLDGFQSLRTLLLTNNSIYNWKDINPNVAFKGATKLETLSLAGNGLTSFSSPDETYILISHSIILLDLSDNKISKLTSGQYILNGVRNLERLILNGNPIRTLTAIESNSLKIIDLINCNLMTIMPNAFENLKNLISLDLSRNSDLNMATNSVGSTDGASEMSETYPTSESLKRLILSYCNLYSIDIIGFPNLISLIFRGNLLKKLDANTFEFNNLIEYLDLSQNVISTIHPLAFQHLKLLKKIDLSFNTIATIHSTTFSTNTMLTGLNLSRNYINRFNKIISKSLIALNLSWCEILKIDKNALQELDNLKILDLSNNLISDLPNGLQSAQLEDLNLNMCRLSSIKNTTFASFPQLTKLRLAGNRFTTTFRQSYFSSNLYLLEIWLGDNPWMCSCQNSYFFDFYLFIMQGNKIKDKNHLRCGSPAEFYGKTWERCCGSEWYPDTKIGTAERGWTIIMSIIILSIMCFCLFSGGRKFIKKYRERRNAREYRANQEERDELRRQNLIHLQQEAQLNAPDARESQPPCYEDALLLPKLERSFKSMDELSTKRKRRHHNKPIDDDNDIDIIDSTIHRHRFLSEERLSNRAKERTQPTTSRKIPRTLSGNRVHYADDFNRFPAAHLKSQNLSSAEQIANLRSSPYSERKWKMHATTDSISFASISDDEIGCHRTSIDRQNFELMTNLPTVKTSNDTTNSTKLSPYSRRRPRGLSVSQLSISNDRIDGDEQQQMEETNLSVHSDHFNGKQQKDVAKITDNNNSKESLSGFVMLSDENASNSDESDNSSETNSIINDSPIVVVHPMKRSQI